MLETDKNPTFIKMPTALSSEMSIDHLTWTDSSTASANDSKTDVKKMSAALQLVEK